MIQKFIFLISNAEICGDGECTWIVTDDGMGYEYWGGLGGSYEYKDDPYNKSRNKRSAGYE